MVDIEEGISTQNSSSSFLISLGNYSETCSFGPGNFSGLGVASSHSNALRRPLKLPEARERDGGAGAREGAGAPARAAAGMGTRPGTGAGDRLFFFFLLRGLLPTEMDGIFCVYLCGY